MSEKLPDNCCDVCDKRITPAIDDELIIYRSWSHRVTNYEDAGVYVDDDEDNRIQTCSACEQVRFNAPELLKKLKSLHDAFHKCGGAKACSIYRAIAKAEAP